MGRKVYGGRTQYMPLKVNYAGVMPIIFAQALLIFPSTIVKMAFHKPRPRDRIVGGALRMGWSHYVFLAAMIFFFSYFWVATQFQPAADRGRSEEVRRLHSRRASRQTDADFLDFTMTRLTFAGAIFLTFIAILPDACSVRAARPVHHRSVLRRHEPAHYGRCRAGHDAPGGDSPIQRHYDGFLRKGRIRGRAFDRSANYGRGDVAQSSTLMWLYVAIAVLVIAGMAIFIYGR